MIISISKGFSKNNNDVMEIVSNKMHVRFPTGTVHCMTRSYDSTQTACGMPSSNGRPAIYAIGTSLFVWCKYNDH